MFINLETDGVLGKFPDGDDAAIVQLGYTLVHSPYCTLLRIPWLRYTLIVSPTQVAILLSEDDIEEEWTEREGWDEIFSNQIWEKHVG